MRYLPLTPDNRESMLARIGVQHIDELFADVPADRLLSEAPALPRGKSEPEVVRYLGALASRKIGGTRVTEFA